MKKANVRVWSKEIFFRDPELGARCVSELTVPELITRGRTLTVPFLLRLIDEDWLSMELHCLELFRLLQENDLWFVVRRWGNCEF